MSIIKFPHGDMPLIDEALLTSSNILAGIDHFIEITENSTLGIPMPLIESFLQTKDILESLLDASNQTENL